MPCTRPLLQSALQIDVRLAHSGRPRVRNQKTELSAELMRQKTLLLASLRSSLMTEVQCEVCSDPTDQVSVDYEKGLAMLVKVRTIAKLRRIDRALQLICTNDDYGRCRGCHDGIPYERLKVQPDAVLCVPCLTLAEKETVQH